MSVEGDMLVEGMVDLSTCILEMKGSGTHTLTYEPLAGSPPSNFGDLEFDNPLGVFEVHSNSPTNPFTGGSCSMKSGTVKFFNQTKGFGFIKSESVSEEAIFEVTGSPDITIGENFVCDGTFSSGNSNIIFTGSGQHTLSGTSTAQSFYDLTVDGDATTIFEIQSPVLEVKRDLTVTRGQCKKGLNAVNVKRALVIDIDGTLFITGGDLSVEGDFTNNGAFVSGNGKIIFAGGLDQTISGSSSISFHDVTVDRCDGCGNPWLGVSRDISISGELHFTAGKIRCLSDVLTLEETASVTGASAQHNVEGTVRWHYSPANFSRTFPTGFEGGTFNPAETYNPATLTCSSAVPPSGGYFSLRVTDDDPVAIETSGLATGKRMHKPMKIYKEWGPSSPQFSLQYQWSLQDNDPGMSPTNLKAAFADLSVAPYQWSLSDVANSSYTSATYVDTDSDNDNIGMVVFGNIDCPLPPSYIARSSGDWSDPNSWTYFDGCTSSNAISPPVLSASVNIPSSYVITLTGNIQRGASTTISGTLDCSTFLMSQSDVPALLTQTGRLFTAHPNGLEGTCPDGITLSPGCTVEYTGGSASTGVTQTITPRVYENLVCSGLQRLGGDLSVLGDMSISPTCSLVASTPSSYTITIRGSNFDCQGSFVHGGDVVFNGSSNLIWSPRSNCTFDNVSVSGGQEVTCLQLPGITNVCYDITVFNNSKLMCTTLPGSGSELACNSISVSPGSTLRAPSSILSVTSSFDMQGSFEHNNGEVDFRPPSGSTCTVCGDFTGTNSFHDQRNSLGRINVCGDFGYVVEGVLTHESGFVSFLESPDVQIGTLHVMGGHFVIKGHNHEKLGVSENFINDGGVVDLDGSHLTVGGDISLNGGVCNGDNSDITVYGNWSQGSPSSFFPGTSRLNWAGTLSVVVAGSNQIATYTMSNDKLPPATVDFSNKTVTVAHTFTNNSGNTAYLWGGTGRLVMSGPECVIDGTSPTTLRHLSILCPSGSCSMHNDVSVQGELHFDSGTIQCPDHTLYLGQAATVTGAGFASFVGGRVAKKFPAGQNLSFTFPTGDPSSFTTPRFAPVTVSIPQLAAPDFITVKTVDGDLPDIEISGLPTGKRMHKPFVFTKELDKSTPLLFNVAVSWDPVFNDAGLDPATLKIAHTDGTLPTQWSRSTPSSATLTSALCALTMVGGDLRLQIGNEECTQNLYVARASGNWDDPASWSVSNGCTFSNALTAPTLSASVVIPSSYAITLTGTTFRTGLTTVNGVLDAGVYSLTKNGGVIKGTIIINGMFITSHPDGLTGSCPDGCFITNTCTIRYAGGSSTTGVSQTVSPLSYGNLIFSGLQRLGGDITVDGDFTIESTCTLQASTPSNYVITIRGSGFTNAGTFEGGGTGLRFEGSNDQLWSSSSSASVYGDVTVSSSHTLRITPLSLTFTASNLLISGSGTAVECEAPVGSTMQFTSATCNPTCRFRPPGSTCIITDSYQMDGIFQHNESNMEFRSLSTGTMSGDMEGSNAFHRLTFSGGSWSCNDPVEASNIEIVVGGVVLVPRMRVGVAPAASLHVSPLGSIDLSGATLEFTSDATWSDQSPSSLYGDVRLGHSATVELGSSVIHCTGDWTNDGGTCSPQSSTVSFSGSSDQIIGGTSSSSFHNLSIGCPGCTSALLLDNDVFTNGAVSFVSGKISSPLHTLYLDLSSTVSGASSSSYVGARLAKKFPAGSNLSFTFPTGDPSSFTTPRYAPVTVSIPQLSSPDYLSVSTVDGDLTDVEISGLPTGKRMHKPFVFTKELDKSTPLLFNVAVSWDPVFNDAGLDPATLKIAHTDGTIPTQWSLSTPSSATLTSALCALTMVGGDLRIQAGNEDCTQNLYVARASGNWSSPNSWSVSNGCTFSDAVTAPTLSASVVIPSSYTITLTGDVFRNALTTIDGTLDCSVFKVRKGGVVTGSIVVNNGNLKTSNPDGLDGSCPDGITLLPNCMVEYYGGNAATGVAQNITPGVYENLACSGGMQQLHSNNIVHRDLSARNCLILANDASLTVEGGWSQGSPSNFQPMLSHVSWAGTLAVTGASSTLRFHDLTVAVEPAHVISGMDRTLEISGSFTNSSSPDVFDWGLSGKMLMSGATSIQGSSGTRLRDLSIDCASGACTMLTDVDVEGVLEFISGKIVCPSDVLTLEEHASVTGADAQHYVEGTVRWHFSPSYVEREFPVGSSGNSFNPLSSYDPATISITTNPVPPSGGYCTVSPADDDFYSSLIAGSGLATGKRMHKPFTITKEWGPSTPLLRSIVRYEWDFDFNDPGLSSSNMKVAAVSLSSTPYQWSLSAVSSATYTMVNYLDTDSDDDGYTSLFVFGNDCSPGNPTYVARSSGAWSDPNTWSVFDGCTTSNATTEPAFSASVSIPAAYVVTLTGNTFRDADLIIDGGLDCNTFSVLADPNGSGNAWGATLSGTLKTSHIDGLDGTFPDGGLTIAGGSTVDYTGGSASTGVTQTITPSVYENLRCSGQQIFSGDVTVYGALTFSNNSHVDGSNANIYVYGLWSQGSPSSFVPNQSFVSWAGTIQLTGSGNVLRFHNLSSEPVFPIIVGNRLISVDGYFMNNSDPDILEWGPTGTMEMKSSTGVTTIAGLYETHFNNLTLDCPLGGCDLDVDVSVSGVLHLASTLFRTNSFVCKLDEDASVTGASPLSFVDGSVEWKFSPAHPVRDFPIGGFDVSSNPLYKETSMQGTNPLYEGRLTASAVISDHPSVSSSGLATGKRMHSYVKIIKELGVADPDLSITFSWSPSEEYPGFDASKLVVAQYDAATGWTYPTVTSVDPVSRTIQCSCNHLSDFVLGELDCASNCNITLNLKMFIQGFYTSGGLMNSPLYNSDPTMDPDVCDFITVELHDALQPGVVVGIAVGSSVVALHTNGLASIQFESFPAPGKLCYIVVKHRNSIETWSKDPVLFGSGGTVFLDFSSY